MENMFRTGTASQQVIANQLLEQRRSSSMNVEQDLVFVILSLHHLNYDSIP